MCSKPLGADRNANGRIRSASAPIRPRERRTGALRTSRPTDSAMRKSMPWRRRSPPVPAVPSISPACISHWVGRGSSAGKRIGHLNITRRETNLGTANRRSTVRPLNPSAGESREISTPNSSRESAGAAVRIPIRSSSSGCRDRARHSSNKSSPVIRASRGRWNSPMCRCTSASLNDCPERGMPIRSRHVRHRSIYFSGWESGTSRRRGRCEVADKDSSTSCPTTSCTSH